MIKRKNAYTEICTILILMNYETAKELIDLVRKYLNTDTYEK